MLNRFYVYHHINPITGEVFYVGKGTGQRAFATEGRNSRWKEAVLSLSLKGTLHSVVIIKSELSEQEALRLELNEINRLTSSGASLTNAVCFHKEGEGPGADQTEALKLELSDRRRDAGITQKTMAALLGKSIPTYAKFEQPGKGITIETLSNCLGVLGCKLAIVPIEDP